MQWFRAWMNTTMTATNAVILAQNLVILVFAPVLSAMDKLSRADLVLTLRSYGENPPTGWTKVELCTRLQELADQGEIEPPRRGKQKTPLEEAVGALNKAASKKSVLQAHVAAMGVKVNGNETIAILQQRAMQFLISTVEASGRGQARVRQVREPDLQPREDVRRPILPLGSDDSGRRGVLDVPHPLRDVAGEHQEGSHTCLQA